MIVCSCHGVNCRRIRAEVRDGASTVKEVGLRCRAGRSCGMCRKQIHGLIKDEQAVMAGSGDATCAVVTLGAKPAAA